MRRLSAVFLAAALSVTAACSGGDKDSGGGSGVDARALFQPAGVVGPDSFAPTFAAATYNVDPSTLTSGDVSGSAPGLYAGRTYGGTGANICDVEAMIRFLTHYEDRGRAWAAVQGITYEELPAYLRGLTPVFALQNLNVQMFGFKNGRSYGYDAVIAAGTAILVDDQGMPRARCACGNPLLGPSDPAPDGTDQPTSSEPEDGNPQTQDSVPVESMPPGDSNPPGDEPTGTPPDDTPPSDSTPPSDGPDPYPVPECPDWSSDPVTYTDPNGMVWIYDRASDTWFSTTDPDLFKYPTDELPGYLDLCTQPEQPGRPGGDCPEPLRGSWTDYYASNGDVWRWEFTDLDNGIWVNQNGDTAATLVEIPGFDADCGTPWRTYYPECPEPFQSADGLVWTDYRASNGDLWVYDPQGDLWKSRDTGAIVAGNDPSGIPGYLDDCGTTTTEVDPCPPTLPSIGDSWTDSSGTVWVYSIGPNRDDGRTSIVWRNTVTDEERSAGELFAEACGEPPLQPSPTCPPTYAPIGTVWIDSTFQHWVYARGTGGVGGWDQVSTPEIETLTFSQLPNQPDGCPQPRLQPDCPPIQNIPEGYVWFGADGDVYRFSSNDGGWRNQTDPAGQVIAYTVLLPGYREQCLPPCPPVNVLDTDEYAMWVDPSNGDVWVRWPGESVWTNTSTGETRSRTQDVPFYTEDCLPPCDPQSAGGSTYVMNDEGIPETNDERRDEYADTDDTAVTVTPGETGVTTQPIVEQLLEAPTAQGDDCNPNGCIEPDAEPELGHSFRDAYGVLWRYVGGGMWQSENGEFVTYLLDVPGYREACLPTDTPIDRECPPEFKGSTYTDSNGIVWTWVGSHSTPDESDHGQYWWYMYEDGSTESRYTFQLESFFDDCPRPDDVSVQQSTIFVSLRVPNQVCVGETVTIAVTVIVPSDADVADVQVFTETAELDVTEVGPGLYSAQFTPDTVGSMAVKGVVTDGDGTETSSGFVVEVVECGDGAVQGDSNAPSDSTPEDSVPADSVPEEPTPSGDNTPPVVTVTATPECIEIETGAQKTYTVTVTASDADGDEMSVLLNNGILGRWTITESGSKSVILVAGERNRPSTLTFTATADDGQAIETSDTASVRVEYPGGCRPTESTITNTAPVVSIATRPSQTIPVCKSGAGSSATVTFSIDVNDPQGDDSTVTLASYNETTRLGTTARSVGSVAGVGLVTATETVTAAQIGQTIEYIARADDGTFVGIARTKITVVERTSGCTTENKAPAVLLADKAWPSCIDQKGTPVTFSLGDTAGSTLTVTVLVNKQVVQSVKKEVPLTGTTSITYTFSAQTAGAAVVVEVVDDKGLKGKSLTTTLTKEICPG